MATLEKIRNNKKTLVLIIGLALAAFILTGAFEVFTQCQASRPIAEFLGVKIEGLDLQKREAQLQQSSKGMDGDQLRSAALQQLINETFIDQEFKDLGLTVTKAELSDYIYGAATAPQVDFLIMQNTGGIATSYADLYDKVRNPEAYGIPTQYAQMLADFENFLLDQFEKGLLQQKFDNLITGTLVANKLDAQAMRDNNMPSYTVVTVAKPYAAIDDADYPVTDEEVKAKWDENRARYEIPYAINHKGDTRALSYIKVNLLPSEADITEAQALVDNAVAQLNGADAPNELSGKDYFNVQTVTFANIPDKDLKAFLDTAAVGDAKLIMHRGYDYGIAKLLGRVNGVDSVNVDVVEIRDAAAYDSIFNGLRDGKLKLADLAENPAFMVTDSVWVSVASDKVLSNLFDGVEAGSYVASGSAYDQVRPIYRLRKAPKIVPVYTFLTAEYTLTTSQDTKSKLFAELKKFMEENGASEDFSAKAAEAGYMVIPAEINNSSYAISPDCPSSRDAVVWAMDAKKGAASKVFEFSDSRNATNGNYLLALTVNDIYSDGFYPATAPNVRPGLESEIRGDKKGDALMAKIKEGGARDIPGFAAAMEATVDTINVRPVMMLGYNPKLVGRIAAAQPNEVVGPFKTDNGVYVIKVVGVDNGRPFDFEQDASTFNSQYGGEALVRSKGIINVLMGREKIKDNSLKVFGTSQAED